MNENLALLRAILNEIDDAIEDGKKTIKPQIISGEEARDWANPNRRFFEGPKEEDRKRDVAKYWPELVPFSKLRDRVQQYMHDLAEKS